MSEMTVLYPFMEDGYGEQTEDLIRQIALIQKSRRAEVLVTVDKTGRISALLKKARLSYDVVPFAKPVGLTDFYLTALFKLMRSSLSLFIYFRQHKVRVVHCPDLPSLLCWGNAAKMNGARFVVSLHKAEKFSHYASLMLGDAARLVCSTEDMRGKLPPRLFSRACLMPDLQDGADASNSDEVCRNIVDFWMDLYASLYAKPDFDKTVGLLSKD